MHPICWTVWYAVRQMGCILCLITISVDLNGRHLTAPPESRCRPEASSFIDLYVYLELEGLRIRKEVLYNWLDATRFTYQDIDDFICKWSCYDVFQIYSGIDLEVTKQTKKAIAILRDLIDRLTVDPLST